MSYLAHLLGWVAIQSAWQTLVVAILLLLSLRLMRGASATRRYHCSVLHLVVAIATIVLSLLTSHASVAMRPHPASADHVHTAWLSGLQDQTQAFLPALAWIWLGGIAIAQGLLALRLVRLKRFLGSTAPAAQDVTAMVEEMSRAIGLSGPPRVACADISSPMVAGEVGGQRSVVIVVPRAFGETHPRSEMRALLAHELAHIIRRDFSRNLLQLFAMSLLWWHPCAWLIYARVRHERECASDEHAIRLTGSAAALAHALLRLAGASMTREAVAIAAGSSGLADRISRIAEPQQSRGGGIIPLFLAGALAALAAIIIGASSTASQAGALTHAFATSAAGPSAVFTIHAHDPAGSFLVKMVRGRVVAIKLGQQPVPSNQVVQRGDTVTVVGASGQELLRLEVDPRGGLRWTPRRRS
jgi:beta-lactamase regulating signal transducer with metallopeptidase domain